MSAAKCWLKYFVVKLLVRTWHVAISVTLCGGRGSLWPDLLHSPQSQVTIYLHGITNAHRAVKCWQKPCLLSEKLRNLVNDLKSVFAPSSTTKFAGDIEYFLWQITKLWISPSSHPLQSLTKSLGRNKHGFPEGGNWTPSLNLSCLYAIKVAELVQTGTYRSAVPSLTYPSTSRISRWSGLFR